jgi:hypothetical protein
MNSTSLSSNDTSARKFALHAIPFVAALAIVAVVYGAVPFVALPTLGQALWISSFAQSFVNGGWPAIFAHNFGIPHAAPIAFGLSGAFLESAFLVTMRLNAADAYSATTLTFLAFALWGAMRYASMLGLRYPYALALALVWGTAPVIWAHASYSMLSIGIAMLPLYLWSALRVCEAVTQQHAWLPAGACFVAVAIFSVFTDGYTFVMFTFGTGIQYAGYLVARTAARGRLLCIGSPVYAAGFGLAFVAYLKFVGGQGYTADPLSIFRGYGVDATMLAFPTQGLLWFWDVLHIGLVRNDVYYFGDASVWITTFSSVFVVLGIVGCLLTKDRDRAIPLLVVGSLAFYLALGPSFKIHSQRPAEDRAAGNFRLDMPAQDAVAPTGTAMLSEYVPGFKSMRASYRWAALGAVSFWALFGMLIAELVKRDRANTAWTLIVLTVLTSLPEYHIRLMSSEVDPMRRTVPLHAPMTFRQQFVDMSQTVVAEFRQDVPQGSTVAFYPQSNDFLAAYLAASANVRTYNIGGDKNLAAARPHWPDSINALFASNPHSLPGNIVATLSAGDATVVVVSYMNLLWDAHRWPPRPEGLAAARTAYAGALQVLAANPRLDVKERPYYAMIALRH